MKIVIISDNHKQWLGDLPQADMLIHAGDACLGGGFKELKEFSKHVKENYNFKYKLFIPGNHDRCFEENEAQARGILKDWIVMINQGIGIEGTNFWGSPVTPPFENWAFNWEDKERKELWDKIPVSANSKGNTNILITHGPPKGIMDTVLKPSGPFMREEHVGCPFLAERIKHLDIKYHIFGHIHGCHGHKEVNGVHYINTSMLDERYQKHTNYKYYEIEI